MKTGINKIREEMKNFVCIAANTQSFSDAVNLVKYKQESLAYLGMRYLDLIHSDFITQSIKQAFEDTRLKEKKLIPVDPNGDDMFIEMDNYTRDKSYNQAIQDQKQKQSEWLNIKK